MVMEESSPFLEDIAALKRRLDGRVRLLPDHQRAAERALVALQQRDVHWQQKRKLLAEQDAEARTRAEREAAAMQKLMPPEVLAVQAARSAEPARRALLTHRQAAVNARLSAIGAALEHGAEVTDIGALLAERRQLTEEREELGRQLERLRETQRATVEAALVAAQPAARAFARGHAQKVIQPQAVRVLAAAQHLLDELAAFNRTFGPLVYVNRQLAWAGNRSFTVHAHGFAPLHVNMSLASIADALAAQAERHGREVGG